MRVSAVAAALFALVLAPVTFAQGFTAVVSGDYDPAQCQVDPPFSLPALQWFDPDRLEKPAADILAIASPDHRRVFALAHGTPGVQIALLSPDGARTPFFSGLPNATESGFAAARNGRLFVPYRESGNGFVAIISAAGALETSVPFPGSGFPYLAVGADHCTLFYRKGGFFTGIIGRFNACTGTELADFATIGARIDDVEVMPDGRVLIASERNVFVYSAGGTLQQTFRLDAYGIPVPLPFPHRAQQVAASPDGRSLYIAAGIFCDDTGTLLQIALAGGTELSRRTIAFGLQTGLVAGLGASAIPTASEVGLLLLAGALAFAGVLSIRR